MREVFMKRLSILKPWKLWVIYDSMRSVYEKVKYLKPWKLWVVYGNERSVYEKVKDFKAMKTLGHLWQYKKCLWKGKVF